MEMDVRHYFESVNFSKFSEENRSGWKYSIGGVIEKKTNAVSVENIQKLDLVIIGVPFNSNNSDVYSSDAPNSIRQYFYQLAKPDQKISIADFGNLKPAKSIKGNYQALRDIVEYFNELKVKTIIIGGSQDLSYGICEAFKGDQLFTLASIDSCLDVKKGKESFNSSNFLSRIFTSNPDLFQFSLLAYQSHYVASEYFSKTKGLNNHVRLGEVRDDITCCEPILRNTDFLSFDIGSVKYSEAPAGNSLNPNGLRSEESCQLARYAGLSDRLKVFGLFEVLPENDQFCLTAKLSAQIIWYYIGGVIDSLSNPANREADITTYQIDIKSVGKPLVFRKNTVSNQWWMELQLLNGKNILLACSEEEYLQASNNDIPELWFKYVQKIDEILK